MTEPQVPEDEPAAPEPRPALAIPRPAGPVVPAKLRKPYDGRQPGESAKAFAAFRAYLELGEFRTIAEVGRTLYPGSGTRRKGRTGRLVAWAKRWGWARRVGLIEKARAEVAREIFLEAAREDARAKVAAIAAPIYGRRRS